MTYTNQHYEDHVSSSFREVDMMLNEFLEEQPVV